MFDTFTSRLGLSGTFETVTAIRIGAGRATSPVSSDLPVVRDALGEPYIPGSSFKGVLRSYVESVLRSLTDCTHIVCNPTADDEQCVPREAMQKLREWREKQRKQNKKVSDAEFAQTILRDTCWVCQLFGSPWVASKLQIRDLHVDGSTWFGQYQQRNGVGIDRDTETARDGLLYDYEVVPAGVCFGFKAVVTNAVDWQLGMLYLGINAFERERIPIGGGSSRGLGQVRLTLDEQYYLDPSQLVKCLDDPDYQGEQASAPAWKQAFRAKLDQISNAAGSA